MVDGLDGLGHDAVLGGHHQNGDIRHHGAAGTHGGKRLVTRGIQEGDGLAVDLHLIGADVLGDAAGLAGGHMGIADIVQQAGLAVVHVAHDHHHGSAGHQILFLVLMVVDQLFLDGDHHFLLHLAAHLLGDDGGGVEVDHLAQRGHDAVLHQALDHFRAGLFHAAGQLAHGDLVGDLHGDRGVLDDLQPQPAHTVGLLLLALVGHGAVLALFGVAELLLALQLVLVTASAAVVASVGHVLQLLIVLVQIHVGGLAGIHHLLLGHAGHGLLGLLSALLIALGLRLLLGLLPVLALLSALLGLLLFRLRLLLLHLCPLGKNGRDAGDLIVLGQILKDERQLPILQCLHMVLGGLGILGQDLRHVLCGDPEILRHLMHSVFVCYATQIKPPPS